MLKEEELIGAIHIYRQEVRPFTDKQIALVQNFAAQAVIAIENTRLLNELRESLAAADGHCGRAAASSVRSPGDLEPVFQAMLENATRICEAKFGSLFRFDGEAFHFARQCTVLRRTCRISKAARTVSTATGQLTWIASCGTKQVSP